MEKSLVDLTALTQRSLYITYPPFPFHDSRWRAMLASLFGVTSHLQSLASRSPPLPHHRALGPRQHQPVPQHGLNTRALPATSCGAHRVGSFPHQVLVLDWMRTMRRESAGLSHPPPPRMVTTVCMLVRRHWARVSEQARERILFFSFTFNYLQ